MAITTLLDLVRHWEGTFKSDVEKIKAAKAWLELSRDVCRTVEISDIEIALWALDKAIEALDKKEGV